MSTISGTTINTGITLGTIASAGTYLSPLTITASGAVETTGGLAVYGPAGAGWTVVNQGTAFGGNGGISLESGGSIDNAGLIEGFRGVLIQQAAGAISNTGTIIGTVAGGIYLAAGGGVNNTGGLIQGSDYGIDILHAAGTVTNRGTIASGIGGGVVLGAGGNVYNDAGLIAGATGVSITGGTSTLTNAGTIRGTSGYGVYLGAGGTVVDSGTISGGSGRAVYFRGAGVNLLVLEQGYHFGGSVIGSGSLGATNTLELGGSLGAAVTASSNSLGLSHFQDALFGAGGNDTLKVANTGGTLPLTISGFTLTSDIVDLTAIGSDGSITGQSATTLTVAGSLGTETLQLDASDSSHFITASDGGSGTDVTVACFLRGTRVLTAEGEVAVEDLAIGDRVMTRSGAPRGVKWIGRRSYDGRFVAGNPAVLPICIAAGAIADGVPARDLFLSPEHALYLDGVLVPAGLIANGMTIRQVESVEQLEYFHLELASHDVILAEGAAAESYVDCDNRLMFQNGGEFAARYPDAVPSPWRFCAPRLAPGSADLPAIRAALSERAAALGCRLSVDPDLHLLADGAIIRPHAEPDDVYRFTLPVGSAAVWLASRSTVPAEVELSSPDRRRLGVAVSRIVISSDRLSIAIGPGHPALSDGFHAAEATHRWTDGRARLPQELLCLFADGATLEVHLTSRLVYRVPSSAHVAA